MITVNGLKQSWIRLWKCSFFSAFVKYIFSIFLGPQQIIPAREVERYDPEMLILWAITKMAPEVKEVVLQLSRKSYRGEDVHLDQRLSPTVK